MFAELANDAGLENLTAGDAVDYLLGSFAAQLFDFSFDLNGVAYAGELVASTPTPGLTYVVYFDAPADEAEILLPDLDAVLYSFDILISGIDRAELGSSQPEFAEAIFVDEYGDPASGLYDDEVAQEWGQGIYDLETEQYVYAMNAASGAIYDYYADLMLPDAFMLQVSAQTAGAIDTAFGLIFHVQDDSHFYAFRISGDGYFLVEKADGETLEIVVDLDGGGELRHDGGGAQHAGRCGGRWSLWPLREWSSGRRICRRQLRGWQRRLPGGELRRDGACSVCLRRLCGWCPC